MNGDVCIPESVVKELFGDVVFTVGVLERQVELITLRQRRVTLGLVVAWTAERSTLAVHVDRDVLTQLLHELVATIGGDAVGHEPRHQTALGQEPRHQTALGQEPRHQTALGQEPCHKTALGQEPRHQTTLGQEPRHQTALGQEPRHQTALGQEPRHQTTLGQESRHQTALGQEPRHQTALGPEPRHQTTLGQEPRHQTTLGHEPRHQTTLACSVVVGRSSRFLRRLLIRWWMGPLARGKLQSAAASNAGKVDVFVVRCDDRGVRAVGRRPVDETLGVAELWRVDGRLQ